MKLLLNIIFLLNDQKYTDIGSMKEFVSITENEYSLLGSFLKRFKKKLELNHHK